MEVGYDYPLMLRDTLTKLDIPDTALEAKKSLGFWRGLRIFRLQSAAFQTAIQIGMTSEIDMDLLEILNALYTAQEGYNEFSKTAA